MPHSTVTKAEWLTVASCPTMAWRDRRTASEPPSEAEQFRMQQGREVGELARQLYPGGVLIKRSEREDTAAATSRLMAAGDTPCLFEAEFRFRSLTARADILVRQDDGWHLMEVKSCFSDTDDLPGLDEDLAYTVMVSRRTGVIIAQASLVLLSRGYRYGMEPGRLFELIGRTAEVTAIVAEAADPSDIEAALAASDPPTPQFTSACKTCPHFSETCLGAGHDHTVLELPRLHGSKIAQLAQARIIALEDVPGDFSLTARQSTVRAATNAQRRHVAEGLPAALAEVVWPCHYLDFETVMTSLPLYPGQGCHQQVLTQFSVHHADVPAHVTGHDEFLAPAERESERALAEQLIAVLGRSGSVVVYSGFEKAQISRLIKRFPDLKPDLARVVDRLVDLCAVLQAQVYDPHFRGSYSIKKVLPVLVPQLSYAGLSIADGAAAITAFARMARGEITGQEFPATRNALKQYCALDTLAMVELHQALHEMCRQG